jgi:hypothetical protein
MGGGPEGRRVDIGQAIALGVVDAGLVSQTEFPISRMSSSI